MCGFLGRSVVQRNEGGRVRVVSSEGYARGKFWIVYETISGKMTEKIGRDED